MGESRVERDNVARDSVVRLSNGSIDYDFYRTRARRLQRAEQAACLNRVIRLLQRGSGMRSSPTAAVPGQADHEHLQAPDRKR